MKINQIIRQKRKELSLTQEQIAEFLGVSTPAVNKWEKGSTYPDITLLPALARLLKVDLNTLMSFNDDLTDRSFSLKFLITGFLQQTGSCLLNLFNLNQQHHRSTHFITHSRHTHHICWRHCFLNSLNLKTTFYKWIQYLR